MSNQNVPTHVFGGGVTLKPNTFPSDADANTTYGGFAPSFLLLPGGEAAQEISATDPLVAFVTPTGGTAIVLTLPNAAASQDGKVYTIYVGGAGAGGGTVQVKDKAGVAIPGTLTTTTAKSAIITVVYDNDKQDPPVSFVVGSTMKSA